MPRVLGFELRELSFGAFSNKRMFDPRWHLRRERFVAFQAAMLICLAAECTATYSLAKYEDLQGLFENTYKNGTHLYQNDLIDAEIVTIVFCVLVACLFGADFFFLLQFPRQVYPAWYNITKLFLAVLITCGILAAALASTIIVATRSAVLSGLSGATRDEALRIFWHPPLDYNTWPTNIAFIVLLWIGWLACVVSTILMFMAADHDKKHGTGPAGGDTASLQFNMRDGKTNGGDGEAPLALVDESRNTSQGEVMTEQGAI